MSIDEKTRYELMFKHWHFASEVRLKMLSALWAVYVGLAAVFLWLWGGKDFKAIAFIVPLLGLIATVLHWFMDDRNGAGIRKSKDIIEKIEIQAEIPEEQRIVATTDAHGWKHATAITVVALIMGLLLIGATVYLFVNRL